MESAVPSYILIVACWQGPRRHIMYVYPYQVSNLNSGGKNFVYMADPNSLESILRAEGKYPRRENTQTPNMEWLITKLKSPVPFAIK